MILYINKDWFIHRSSLTKLLSKVKKKQSLFRKKVKSCEERLASRKSSQCPQHIGGIPSTRRSASCRRTTSYLKESHNDTETSLDDVVFSAKRLSQHIWEFQETLCFFAGSRGIYKTRNLPSMRCQDIVHRSLVSKANFSSRNVANSLTMIWVSCLFNSSVRVERSNPFSEVSSS